MKRLSSAVLISLLLTSFIRGQLSSPKAEGVYGGRINAMSVIKLSATKSRVFISTESANSVFYVDNTTSGSTIFGTFVVMPDVGNDDGYGSGIDKISAHEASGYLFFINNGSIFKASTAASSIFKLHDVSAGNATALLVYNASPSSYFYYIEGSDLHFGTLDGSSNFSEDANSPRSIGATPVSPVITVNPSNSYVYVCDVNSTPVVYKSSDPYDSFGGSTSFSSLTATSLSADTWTAFDAGPDGTLFLGGSGSSVKVVAYSTDDGSTWNSGSTSITGTGGTNFGFGASSSPYTVYFADVYAVYTNGSGFGSWSEMGNSGLETHPNDGSVAVDPNNTSVIYMTTDQGIGKSTDGGATISEMDDGVEAVQVQDFSLNPSSDVAWAASKSGVRKVTDFTTGSGTWTNALFPTSDGSPYYSAEINSYTGDTAFAGNVRVYKTTDGGSNWTNVFTAENVPYSFSSTNSQVQAIEVDPYDPNMVLAGYTIDNSTDQGGVFYSSDGGGTWGQLLCRAGSTGQDVDVNDIIITRESGNDVAYIGVYYDTSITSAGNRGRSIYRAEWDSATSVWSVRQDMDGSYTSTGSAITASIYDLQISGDTVFAAGTDAGATHAITYFKIYSGTNKWTPITTSGLPASSSAVSAIAQKADTIAIAVSNQIYLYKIGFSSSWTLGYSYPNGTQINVLYYDGLVVGTGTGLYDQSWGGGALPVELTTFEGTAGENFVRLSWRTATEVNNYGFEVQRSPLDSPYGKGGKSGGWSELGFVKGGGTNNSSIRYSFIDNNISTSGVYLYRLKQIDLDGSYKFSKTIDVAVKKPESFSLEQNYPNPFNPSTTIRYSIPQAGNVRIELYNMLGENIAVLVNEKKEAGSYKIQLSAESFHLASGVYIYKMRSGKYSIARKLMLLK